MICYVPQDIYDRLDARLSEAPEKAADALRKTINSVAKDTRKNIVIQVKGRYTLKRPSQNIKGAMTTEFATNKYPQATVLIKGGSIPIYDFKIKKNGKRVSAGAKVLKESSIKKLTLKGAGDNGKDLKAFIKTVKNTDKDGRAFEHIGVFRRMTGEERAKSSGTGKKNAIKQFYGVPIAKMAENEKVQSKIQKDIYTGLRDSLDRHIAQVLGGK